MNARSGDVVRHSCDNPSCINPDHLTVGTQQENIADRRNRNRGVDKLSDTDIPFIRALLTVWSVKRIAERYAVTRRSISMIRDGVTWKHIPLSKPEKGRTPMIKNLRYVEGEPVTNRARYWVFTLLQNRGVVSNTMNVEGISRKTVWSFVSNRRSMTIEKLALLAEYLEVDFRDLFAPTPEEMATPNER